MTLVVQDELVKEGLRLPIKLSVVLSLRMAWKCVITLAVSLVMASVICLLRVASLSWLRFLLAWQALQASLVAVDSPSPVASASLCCSLSLSLFLMFEFEGDSGWNCLRFLLVVQTALTVLAFEFDHFNISPFSCKFLPLSDTMIKFVIPSKENDKQLSLI